MTIEESIRKEPKILYQYILVHCLHVSIQEFQKKIKMFQKKAGRARLLEQIKQPDLQYINIHESSTQRLPCF